MYISIVVYVCMQACALCVCLCVRGFLCICEYNNCDLRLAVVEVVHARRYRKVANLVVAANNRLAVVCITALVVG